MNFSAYSIVVVMTVTKIIRRSVFVFVGLILFVLNSMNVFLIVVNVYLI